jgi:hypothetical protein
MCFFVKKSMLTTLYVLNKYFLQRKRVFYFIEIPHNSAFCSLKHRPKICNFKMKMFKLRVISSVSGGGTGRRQVL